MLGTFYMLYAGLTVVLLVVAFTNLRWMLDAWLQPDSVDGRQFVQEPDPGPQLSFSLVVPARHEEAVLGETLDELASLDHPCFEVLVVVGHDDDGTATVARAAAARHPECIQVVVDENWPKNKPKALNTALPLCHGDIVGIFDAEDGVAIDLLSKVDACFRRTNADIVQGGVQLMNFQSSWYALKNVLEYFFYFGSRLHLHARQRFIPLGGNTVFFRREVLEHAGGWDPDCLAEDCEIGVRLSCAGATTVVAYEPALVTREEAPTSIRDFLRQRTRWNQGFLQVLRKRQWQRLPSRGQRARAVGILGMPFLQAAAALALPAQLVSLVILRVPIALALFSWLPMLFTIVTLAVEIVGFHEFCRAYGLKARLRDYARLVVGFYAYYLLLACAALNATRREFLGERGWDKTSHVGAHRVPDTAIEGAA